MLLEREPYHTKEEKANAVKAFTKAGWNRNIEAADQSLARDGEDKSGSCGFAFVS
ncbi:MAG: hypothetical protein QOG23_3682 [Blastocatellia bacterium]|nr:hypothetical protein [Blastocatellia bacterium]